MKTLRTLILSLTAVLAGALAGCDGPPKSPDVSENLRTSLDQAGFKDVSSKQDRDKGVVTLSGRVPTEADKQQAESIAKSIAPGQVVANQIAVVTPGAESDAKAVNYEMDKGIEHNLEAALIKEKLVDNVKYKVKNRVVTLTGEVASQSTRARAEKVAAAVLNVQQVVNELQVKNQKATSTK